MDYEKPPKKLKNLVIIILIIFFLGLILFLNNIYLGKLFVLFLILLFFLFSYLNRSAKRKELENALKIRENRIRYLFKNLPEEFP